MKVEKKQVVTVENGVGHITGAVGDEGVSVVLSAARLTNLQAIRELRDLCDAFLTAIEEPKPKPRTGTERAVLYGDALFPKASPTDPWPYCNCAYCINDRTRS